MKYAIVAEFEARPGYGAELEQILKDTAAYTLRDEPLCLRFEILQACEEDGTPIPDRFLSNELFASFAGIEAHRADPRTPGRRDRLREICSHRRLIHAGLVGGA